MTDGKLQVTSYKFKVKGSRADADDVAFWEELAFS